MPNSKQHKDKAAHNQSFLATIALAQFHDWGAVVAFYTAVHLVERLRTLLPSLQDQHSLDHHDRMQFVQRHHAPIHTPYHELFNAALIARYQTTSSFCKQFTIDDVETILIHTYLAEIEAYVANRFAPPPPPPASA